MFRNKQKSILIILVISLLSIAVFHATQQVYADIKDEYKVHIRKLMNVIHLAQLYYVEDVEWNKAIEGAISGMLETLDPHSVYIEDEKAEENKENFSGKYEGIGIRFDIIDGYLTVIAPIAGTPSDQLGIIAGDRIIKIDGESAIGISTDEVYQRLKGPKGTTVNITIDRQGTSELLEYTITRDVIPIHTVTAKFMADDSTGYIMLNRFASTTSSEIEKALLELEEQNANRLILDLRRNPGGYLHEAVKLTGKFIPGHKLIVYTKGRSGRIEDEYYSDQFGSRTVWDYPLIILIDHGSASASEIVAGALQDYDRALIVGKTSFGKGLVQKEFNLQDGSAVRITTAKYYTPLGRSIQREYKGKRIEEYYSQLGDSNQSESDSIETHPLYYTKILGRTVYGGGGIKPDIEVDHDGFPNLSDTAKKVFEKRLIFQFANTLQVNQKYIEDGLSNFQDSYEVSNKVLDRFQDFCLERDLKINVNDFNQDVDFIKLRIKAEIARKNWRTNGYYFVILNADNQYLTALKNFNKARKLAALNR